MVIYITKEVKIAAKSLPLPVGSVDDHGSIKNPQMFGKQLNQLVDDLYHQKKYLAKVSVPSSAPKRPPPAQKEPVETKKFIMDAKKGSASSSRPKRGGRGRGSRYASRNDSKKTASQGRGEKKGF